MASKQKRPNASTCISCKVRIGWLLVSQILKKKGIYAPIIVARWAAIVLITPVPYMLPPPLPDPSYNDTAVF